MRLGAIGGSIVHHDDLEAGVYELVHRTDGFCQQLLAVIAYNNYAQGRLDNGFFTKIVLIL